MKFSTTLTVITAGPVLVLKDNERTDAFYIAALLLLLQLAHKNHVHVVKAKATIKPHDH